MPNGTLPYDALTYYVADGKRRSLRRIARRFGVDRSVVKRRADAEDWPRCISRLKPMPGRDRERAPLDLEVARFAALVRDEPSRAREELVAMEMTDGTAGIMACLFAIMLERSARGLPWNIYDDEGGARCRD